MTADEISVLRNLRAPGSAPPVEGPTRGAVIFDLQQRGLVAQGPRPRITAAGVAALEAEE